MCASHVGFLHVLIVELRDREDLPAPKAKKGNTVLSTTCFRNQFGNVLNARKVNILAAPVWEDANVWHKRGSWITSHHSQCIMKASMCAWHVAFPPVLVAVPCGRKRAQTMGTRNTALITTSFPNPNGSVADATRRHQGFNVQAHAVNTPPLQYYKGIVASEVSETRLGSRAGGGASIQAKFLFWIPHHRVQRKEYGGMVG